MGDKRKMTEEMYEDLLKRNSLQISELNTLTEEQDKHIIELEKENAELKEKLEKETAQRIYNFNKSIEWKDKYRVSQKENAELKEKLKPENCLKLLVKGGYIKFTSEQLTKAKEKIRNLLEIIERPYQFNAPQKIQMVKEAEQFLSEVEK